MIKKNIETMFADSIAAKQAAIEILPAALVNAVELCAAALKDGKKIMVCGNGGSAADAQHFSAELLCRFERERGALPAIALTTDTSTLTAISNDYDYANVFSRQVEGLGNPGDVLIGISTSGNSKNVAKAITAAHDKQMSVVVLSGKDGGEIANQLKNSDIELRAPSNSTARIQEIHILCLHCLCAQIDEVLFA